jgi:predicted permease
VTRLRRLATRLVASLLGRRDDDRVREELAGHLEMLVEEYVRSGLPLDQARRMARLRLGAPGAITEAYRDEQRLRPLEDLWRDLRHASRVLRRQRAFTLTAVLTLALATGATTAIFTVIDATLLRALPYPHADRLVQVARSFGGKVGGSVSEIKFLHWRRESRSLFTDVAAYSDLGTGFTLVGKGEPERVTGSLVSAAFFDVLGIQPALGRGFREDEDLPGRPRVVVLSHALWSSRFAADPAIVGQPISLNAEPHVVIGVAPEGFRFPDAARLWTLFRFDPASQDRAHNFYVVGRLRSPVTLEQAHAAMGPIGASLARLAPDLVGENESAGVRPLRERVYGDLRRPLLILLASAGLVLLIGCVNVANLQLTQTTGRRREIALRIALGAGGGTVMRQLLAESVLLAVAGGLAGVALAYLLVPSLLALSPMRIPNAEGIGIDWRVLGFSLATSLAAGLAFGLLPARQSAHVDLEAVLRGASRTAGHASRWTRHLLVGGQVALALMLTVGAFLLVRSLHGLLTTPPGFDAAQVLTMKVVLPEAEYGNGRALAQYQEQVEERLAALPGVRAASVAALLPLQLESDMVFAIEGQYVPGTRTGVGSAQHRVNGPGYFEALRIPLRRGRLFTALDRADTVPVVLINEAAAARYWPHTDPIGQRITLGKPDLPTLTEPNAREVIGIVGDVREVALGEAPEPTVYVPMSQQHDSWAALATRVVPFSLAVRADARAADLTRAVQQAVWSVDPQQPISEIRLLEDIVAQSVGPQRFNTLLLGGLAGLALLLAAVGLYGTVSHLVRQQTREIGVRMALGATRAAVIGLFLRHAAGLVLVGVVVGVIGALGLTRVMRGLLTGVGTADPWAFTLATTALLVVGLVAALLPARHAASVSPTEALRD